MPGCAAVGCNNRSEKGYTMKCFPRNEKLRQIWKDRVARADWEPSHNSFLCHAHFEADQWTITQSGRIKLKKSAIPSIFTITSTRKSPKKRRKLTNIEDEDLYIIEYLDDDPVATLKPSRLTNDLYARRFLTSVCTATNRGTGILMPQSKNHKTNDVVNVNSKDIVSTRSINGIVKSNDKTSIAGTMNNVKIEATSPIIPDDDIDAKLRLICGEDPEITEKEQEKSIGGTKNAQSSRKSWNIDEDYSPNFSGSRKNAKTRKIQENGIAPMKRRSRFEIMKYMDDDFKANNSQIDRVNGVAEKKMEKKSVPETTKLSTFTIKLTGVEEDVTEIVEGLGTEPILKYKTGNDSCSSKQNVITSVISITDRSMKKMTNHTERIEPKSEIHDKSGNLVGIENTTAMINEESRTNEERLKLSVESPDEDRQMSNCDQLKKKIKFQENVIRKLMDQLIDNKLPNNAKYQSGVSTRSQSRRQQIFTNYPNESSQEDNKNTLLSDITASLNQSKDINKRLTKLLVEHEDEAKALKSQIRQRDNRIKELNWKLNKASKYLERAEKNTNTYRRKMLSMQSLLTRRKKRDEQALTTSIDESLVKYENNSCFTEKMENSVFSNEKTRVKIEEMSNDNIVCKTVQDIFDESNNCNDDDPIFIDNPEDFMRQFGDSL